MHDVLCLLLVVDEAARVCAELFETFGVERMECFDVSLLDAVVQCANLVFFQHKVIG